MDRLQGLKIFAAIATHGSFVRAADQCAMAPAQVTRHIHALERALGVRLFHRTTRQVRLTEAGAAFHGRIQPILAALDEAQTDLMKTEAPGGALRGPMRVSAPVSLGISHLGIPITRFLEHHPEVRLDLGLNDRAVDLIEEGVDLALRIGVLQDSATLTARRLAPIRLALCAAPAYLARQGRPATPSDLERHACLGYAYWASPRHWQFGDIPVRIEGPLQANNGDLLRQAALAGLGIILQPTFLVGQDLRAGHLEALLVDFPIPERALYAIYPSRHFNAAKVRRLVAVLADYLGDIPPWDRE